MLENIKSPKIMRILFNNLYEERKMKLIIYNKRIQNILNISIMDYKLLSGRYIVLEENSKGKEYYLNNDSLIYEGEYLNLKRNGIGKEYNNDGTLIYDGKYKNGKRYGKGKEYNNDNILIFEGIFINNLKWKGIIKE